MIVNCDHAKLDVFKVAPVPIWPIMCLVGR